MKMGKHDVARLRQRIALEYEAAMRGPTSLTITAPHKFITARIEEHIAGYHEKLQALVFINNPVTL
jgi:hypothetical protein